MKSRFPSLSGMLVMLLLAPTASSNDMDHLIAEAADVPVLKGQSNSFASDLADGAKWCVKIAFAAALVSVISILVKRRFNDEIIEEEAVHDPVRNSPSNVENGEKLPTVIHVLFQDRTAAVADIRFINSKGSAAYTLKHGELPGGSYPEHWLLDGLKLFGTFEELSFECNIRAEHDSYVIEIPFTKDRFFQLARKEEPHQHSGGAAPHELKVSDAQKNTVRRKTSAHGKAKG